MRYKTVKTAETWAKIQSMGDYDSDYKNGELWWFNGELYYLSHLELSPETLKEIVAFNEGPVRI